MKRNKFTAWIAIAMAIGIAASSKSAYPTLMEQLDFPPKTTGHKYVLPLIIHVPWRV